MFEHSPKKLPLAWRSDAWNNHDQPGVQGDAIVERQKIGAIIHDQRILQPGNELDELPVFRSAKAQIVDVIRHMSRASGQFDQRRVQALVDQQPSQTWKLRQGQGQISRVCRGTLTGSRTAHGRRLGRPRFGKALT